MMAADKEKHEFNRELYEALMKENQQKVIELCGDIPEGPFHILTIHNDTVLHMATYSKQEHLVLGLLEKLPPSLLDKMTRQNDIGNTILHEVATYNGLIPAASEMLSKAPKLLLMRNRLAETALFRAARYGQKEMFEFLDRELNKLFKNEGLREEARNAFFKREDKTTILHMSILSEYFDLALFIAEKYEFLIGEKDGDGMTALQLLACNPSAFKSGSKLKYHYQKRRGVTTEDTPAIAEVESCCQVPLWEVIRNKEQRYKSALKLAKFLIARDTSWEATGSGIQATEFAKHRGKPKTHTYGGPSTSSQMNVVGEGLKAPRSYETSSTVKSTAETPLILATKYGIIEIVDEILKMYPQAVEHIDDKGHNILHVAIMYRQIHIFDFVKKNMDIPMKRLVRNTDHNGNSILHMVGKTAKERVDGNMRSPCLLLQEDLLLFERVEEVTANHFINHLNDEGKTAAKLLADNTDELRKDATEWLKRTAENCSIVAVLITTVAFAAAYTIPGGPNQNTGYPILSNQPFFIVFTISDVLSLTLALTSVFQFLSILASPFQLNDFKHSLTRKLMFGFGFMISSVAMMMLAFAATIVLMIHNKQQWTKIIISSTAFLPVSLFALTCLPLYKSVLITFKHLPMNIGEAFPRFNTKYLQHWIRKDKSLKFPKSQNTIHSNPNQSQPTCSHISTCPSTLQNNQSFV